MPVRALAFDVFGTVVDWRGSIAAEVAATATRHGVSGNWEAFADAWRSQYQPSLDRVRRGEIGWTALDDLHRSSLDRLLPEFGLDLLDEGERRSLNLAWHRLQPWPDSRPGLVELGRHRLLTTLSNGNFSLLTDLVKNAGLAYDCIMSAELCRAYKPDVRTYRMVPELLRLDPSEVMMVAAHPDDLRAAARAGLRTAHVPRPLEWGAGEPPPPASDPAFDVVAVDFVDLSRRLAAWD